jgi:hypothetical protein
MRTIDCLTTSVRDAFVKARSETEIDAVFATFGERRVSALLVNTDPFFLARHAQFVAPGGTQWDHRDLRATRVRCRRQAMFLPYCKGG